VEQPLHGRGLFHVEAFAVVDGDHRNAAHGLEGRSVPVLPRPGRRAAGSAQMDAWNMTHAQREVVVARDRIDRRVLKSRLAQEAWGEFPWCDADDEPRFTVKECRDAGLQRVSLDDQFFRLLETEQEWVWKGHGTSFQC
jgi:hypothetical protein